MEIYERKAMAAINRINRAYREAAAEKELYRITDLELGSRTDQKLRIDTKNDVIEVEETDGIYSTFQVWLTDTQVNILAAVGDTSYEKIA